MANERGKMYPYGGKTFALIIKFPHAVYRYLKGCYAPDRKKWTNKKIVADDYTQFQQKQYDHLEQQRKEQQK